MAPAAPTGTPAGGQLPTAPAPTGGLNLDPVLKYKAAAYLNQEVQLLNQEIDNAAVRECFVPYVVKLKLAVMIYRPYLAYSIHTRMSFVSGTNGEAPPTPADVMQAARTLQAAGLLTNPDSSGAALTSANGTPLFSTDLASRLSLPTCGMTMPRLRTHRVAAFTKTGTCALQNGIALLDTFAIPLRNYADRLRPRLHR